MKKATALVLALLMVFALVSCSSNQAATTPTAQASAPVASASGEPQANIPSRLTIGSSAATGTFYAFSGAISNVLTQHVGVKVCDITNVGGSVNVILGLCNDTCMMGACADPTAYAAWTGGAEFKNTVYQDFRLAMPLYISANHVIVKAGSDIKTFSDLEGKTVAIGEAGKSYNLRAREFFNALGITPGKIVESSSDDTNNAFKDDLVDAMFLGGYLPEPNTASIDATTDIRLIGFTDDEVAKIHEAYPYLSGYTIPAGTYKCVKEDLQVVANTTSLFVSKDADEGLIYEMVKNCYQYKDEMAASAEAASRMDPKDVLSTAVVPLHKGAIRYFEEAGIKIPDQFNID